MRIITFKISPEGKAITNAGEKLTSKLVRQITLSQLGRKIHIALLNQLCYAFEEVARKVIT